MPDSGVRRLELFTCGPYDVRLTPTACAKRFDRSAKYRVGTVAGQGLSHCRGCEVGRVHSRGGETKEPLSLVMAHVSPPEILGKKLQLVPLAAKLCACGQEFWPETRSSLYCHPRCSARPGAGRRRPLTPPRQVTCKCGVSFTVQGSSGSSRRWCDGCKMKGKGARRAK